MGFLLWILFGAIAGWVASIIMRNDAQQGTLTDIILGVAGAVAGGWMMNLLGEPGVNGFNLYSLLVAVGGAMVLIYLGRVLIRRA